jgi:hypothetical protein
MQGLWRAIQINILTRRGSYPSVTCQKSSSKSRQHTALPVMIFPSFLDLEGVFGTTLRVLRIDGFASPFNSVGRHVADASLFAAVVNILAVFRLERAPGWNVGPDAEGVKWTGGLTT